MPLFKRTPVGTIAAEICDTKDFKLKESQGIIAEGIAVGPVVRTEDGASSLLAACHLMYVHKEDVDHDQLMLSVDMKILEEHGIVLHFKHEEADVTIV